MASIFVVVRRPPWTTTGSPWVAGRTYLLSRGLKGHPANGASYAPHVSGDSAHAPQCVAFLSRASNLVHGDTNGKVDAFIAQLGSGKITRVSVGSAGQQANGAATEVKVDGACTRVAFVSDATNLQPSADRSAAHWPGARATVITPHSRQAYVHYLNRRGSRAARLAGLTMLVSRNGRAASNRGAVQIAFASKGQSVAYVSNASNLGAATGGVAQVWQADIGERLAARYKMRMHVTTRLVSRTLAGAVASGPSITPSIDHDGGTIAFATLAPELTGIPASPIWQIVKSAPHGQPVLPIVISEPQARQDGPKPGNASSFDPAISEGGQWVFFDSSATNLLSAGRTSPQRLVWRWTDPSLRAGSDISGLQIRSIAGQATSVRSGSSTPSEAPASSARGNYMAFESEDPGLGSDQGLVANGPSWLRALAAARPDTRLYPGMPRSAFGGLLGAGGTIDSVLPTAPWDPRLHQVYLRYLGPQ